MNQRGYTLFEVVVVIAIIGILTVVTARAYPAARSSQSLRLAEQQLQSTLREAQQRAINEERETDCLAIARTVDEPNTTHEQRQCSDIGVYVDGQALIMFADTDLGPDDEPTGDFEYTPGLDLELKTLPLPSGVSVRIDPRSSRSFVFKGIPPRVELYVDGALYEEPGVVLLESTGAAATLQVLSHGQVIRTN